MRHQPHNHLPVQLLPGHVITQRRERLAAVPPERAGSAVGISETSLELGNALGLSLFGSLAALVFPGGDFAPTLGETLARTCDDPARADAAQRSFVTGTHVATTTGAGLLVLTAAAAVLGSRSIDPTTGPGVQQLTFAEPDGCSTPEAYRDLGT